jgi:hypothetical protein
MLELPALDLTIIDEVTADLGRVNWEMGHVHPS